MAILLKPHGHRVEKVETIKWYHKAAEQGNAKARTNLGLVYVLGWRCVPKDNSKAYMWLNLVAPKDHEGAKEHRVALSQEMSQDQIAEESQMAQGLSSTAISPSLR